MSEAASHEAAIGLSNARDADLLIWFEPWCDEIRLPARAELLLVVEGAGDLPEMEWFEDHLTVYGAAGTRLHVHIDGARQDTASCQIAVPDMEALSTRQFVGLVFGAFPEARAGGVPMPRGSAARRWLGWLFRWRQG